MADVSSDGPFSRFEKYDRVLVLLNGRGLNLKFAGDKTVELREVYDQTSFPGDVDTYATLHDGPIKDFNVIVDRKTLKAAVTIAKDGDDLLVPTNADALVVMAIEKSIIVTEPGNGDNRVRKGDLFIVQQPEPGRWRIAGAMSIVTLLVQRN